MSSTVNIDLEKITLRFPRAKLRGTAQAHIELSSAVEDFGVIANDVAALEQIWVRRSHRLRLELEIMLDERPVECDMRTRVESMLMDAKVCGVS
jgi:hypothetical protein